MKHIRNFVVLFFIFSFLSIFAQEQLGGMYENPVLRKFVLSNPQNNRNDKAISVKMPFLDDFSCPSVVPDQSLWLDKNVYVNDGFGKNTITIGCATFDAFNWDGQIYSSASSFPFVADTLTSQVVRLDSVFGSSPHIATPADSVYFSFFYQPQGNGDKPEPEDSLMLEFFNPVLDEWQKVWSASGMSLQDFIDQNQVSFKPVMIPITNPDFFSPEFAFRFLNIVSLPNNSFPTWAGNVDHWNIDYVYLNAGRSIGDSLPVDVAFNYRIPSLLQTFSSMPWSHFIVAPANHMVSSVSIPYSNYSATLLNLTERLVITDLSGTTAGYNSGISASNLNPNTDTVFYRSPFPYTFSTLITENADFLVEFIINSATIPDMNRNNDTLAFYQRFYNYFSYDDSTPETGYALVGTNAKLAYQFILNHPDTLRTVQIQFNRVLDDVNEDLYFTLTVWSDDGGKPGNVLYEQSGMRPHVNGMYGFNNYLLNEPLPVSGTIYVGWKQQDSDALNIGFDRNTNKNTKIFYNIDGLWNNSMFEGALMMRLIVGDSTQPYVGIDVPSEVFDLQVYPNPVRAGENFYLTGNIGDDGLIRIYYPDGRLISEQILTDGSIHAEMKPGLYIISYSDSHHENSVTFKLIVTE